MDSQPPVSPPAETQKKSFLDRFRRAPTQLENPDDRRLEVPAKQSLTRRLRNALSRTGEGIGAVFLGGKAIDDALLDELETLLLTADVGVEVTNNILAELVGRLRRRELKDSIALHTIRGTKTHRYKLGLTSNAPLVSRLDEEGVADDIHSALPVVIDRYRTKHDIRNDNAQVHAVIDV